MQQSSPYAPPQRELLDEQQAYASIKVLSASGRIGRLRYIGYSLGIAILGMLIMRLLLVVVASIIPANMSMPLVFLIIGLSYLGIVIVNVLLTIQRCHDFNATGWLSLLLVIPFVPLLFWFIPGTKGSNSYGAQPPPNGGGAVIAAVLAFILVIGILAAIAIPAYQGYVARAHEMGM